jgi:hypothetical protein
MTATSLTHFTAAATVGSRASMLGAGAARRASLYGNGRTLAWRCVR